ncbi:Cdc25 family phosphatase [Methanosarcinales archaeon]|nr:Cdc25 family phosphatase [Methanosarcinales archaeon]
MKINANTVNKFYSLERFKIIILSIVILAIFSGCVSDTKPTVKNQYTDISVQQGKGMIDRQEVFILDVRTKEEYAAGHIKGSTLLAVQDIPEQELTEKLKDIPKDRKILVYCRSGQRSAKASGILVENGYSQVYNMQGGITEWMNAGYEVEK